MAPATGIETSLLGAREYVTECSTCLVDHQTKHSCNNSHNIIATVKHEINNNVDSKKSCTNSQKVSPLRAWEKKMGFKTQLIWSNLIFISLFHIINIVWVTYDLMTANFPKWQSILYAYVVGNIAGFGVTGGAHRYWTHRSFKATRPLQWILILCYSVAGQNSIYNWVRDHRVHHKFSETSADPHDANRGFFFSHVGWLMMKKHPDVIRKGRKIDMSDILNDPLVQFHTKHFMLFKIACCFVLPTLVPPLAWGETWHHALLSQVFLRYMFSLNCTWAVNSFAHLWGNKPYDPDIMPSENWVVSVVALGEGWHNYHHTFPWDYKAAERAYSLNLTTLLLDGFAALGWAHHMKQASPQLIQALSKNRNNTKS